MPEVWKSYELPACLVDQYLAQPGDVCTAGLKIAFGAYSVGHHLQDRSCSWVMGSSWELLREDRWMFGEIKNTRGVDGNLSESIPPVNVVSSPQQRLVELKVKLLLYCK